MSAGAGRARMAGAAVAALALAGCGGGSQTSASSPPSASVTATTSVAASITVRHSTPARPAATHSPHATTSTTSVATPPPGTAAGTPSPTGAPDGLRAAPGYASYELCASVCSGSVPASIRRPVRIPSGSASSCPVSSGHSAAGFSGPALGGGPVFALGIDAHGTLATNSFIGSAWSAGRVTWVSSPGYTGPVLIRGREVGGSGAVGFGEGHVPVDEMQLSGPAGTSPGEPAGSREWPSFARVKSPGCYAFQVDGTSFSTTIVFRATSA